MRSLRSTAGCFLSRYVRDPAFRGDVGLRFGSAFGLLYAAFHAVTGFLYSSVWSITSAVYFFLLGAMRAGLWITYRRRPAEGAYETVCYRRVGRLLFLLNIPMGGLILLTVSYDTSNIYPGYVIYAVATYTFYVLTVSLIGLSKVRKLSSPILSAAKMLNVVAALMSIFTLQNTMISTFSGGDEAYRHLMSILTGTGVYFAVIAVAVRMLIRPPQQGENRE